MQEKTKLPLSTAKEPIIMALSLDRESGTEKIRIGTETAIRAHLEGKPEAVAISFGERPLGQLLFDFGEQNAKEWNTKSVFPLKGALQTAKGRAENEAAAWQFLSEKLELENAVSVFMAEQILQGYSAEKACFQPDWCVWLFDRKMLALTRSFQGDFSLEDENCTFEFLQLLIQNMMQTKMEQRETDLRIWYPWKHCNQEWVVTNNHILSLLVYYLNRLQDWGFRICTCDVCGCRFIARSGHYTLCGDTCRAEQKHRNEQAYDERARENGYDKDYQRSTQRMRRRLNKYEDREGVTAEQCEMAEVLYAEIREKGKKMKKKIKTEENYRVFRDWLFEQERLIDNIYGGPK